MADERELIEIIEDALLDKLKLDMPSRVQVNATPNNPSDWSRMAAKGCALVRYAGGDFDAQGPLVLGRPYLQSVRYQVFTGAPANRVGAEHVGAYRLLAQSRRSILGSSGRNIEPLRVEIPESRTEGPLVWTPSTEQYFDELNATWWYVTVYKSSKFEVVL